VSDTLLQSTLRELHTLLSRPRLWVVFALMVGLFVVTGPFGTYERLAFPTRLGYWLVLHAATWTCALASIAFFDTALSPRVPSRLHRMLTGAVVSALPVGVAISVINFALLMRPLNGGQILENALVALPIGLAFSALTWLSISAGDQLAQTGQPAGQPGAAAPVVPGSTADPAMQDPANTPATAARPALLDRLPVEKRGALIRLEVQDHYVLVVTTRGTELLLMRLGDAIGEAGPGRQVHRSHWVAEHPENFLVRGAGKNGRLAIRAADGADIPVSRSYAAQIQRWIEQRSST
jgi:DNA-binding LytR/AlgR family response regulator